MLRFFVLAAAVVSLAACAGEAVRSDKSSTPQTETTVSNLDSFTERAARTRLGEIQLERVDEMRISDAR